ILQQQRRAANQHLASLRCDRGRVTVHGGKFERDQAIDRVAAHARQPRSGSSQRFQCFPLGLRQIVVEFFVHGASAFLQRVPQFLWRLIASAREIRATATSRDFDKRPCAVTSSCHWNQLNVSNHTDGRIKTPAQNCVSTGRQKDRPIAATLKRKLLTKGKYAHRPNTSVELSIPPDLIARSARLSLAAAQVHYQD